MEQNKNNYHSSVKFKSLSASSQGELLKRQCEANVPFYEVVEDVKSEIDFDCFGRAEKEQAEEICLMIAEVLKLPPEAKVRIAGNDLTADMVATIFHRLTHEHIALVMENYGKAAYEIHHKKTYLRTALYNSVFEIESHYVNLVKTDLE